MKNNINLYYWDAKPNFGDGLNVTLIERLFGNKINKATTGNCEAVFIGSILQHFRTTMNKSLPDNEILHNKKVEVWGTGFIGEQRTDEEVFIRDFHVNAVRGKLTLGRMKRFITDERSVVLADPGILASELIPSSIEKKYSVGIIPHYKEKELPIFHNINMKNSIVIDVQEDIIDCIKKIAQCELILSSSLHGLIVADSLGIPNARILASDMIIGGDYKYIDYYSAFGLEEQMKINVVDKKFPDIDLQKVYDNYCITDTMVNKMKGRMIKSFPF